MPKLRDAWESKVKEVEGARRRREYSLMRNLGSALLGPTAPDNSAEALTLRARIYYEYAMQYQQDYLTLTYESDKRRSLQRGYVLNEMSFNSSEMAGDALDALFTLVNLSGFYLPRMNKTAEAFEGLARASVDGEKGASMAKDEHTKRRYLRCQLNADVHMLRLNLAIDGPGTKVSRSDMRTLLTRIRANPMLEDPSQSALKKDADLGDEWLKKKEEG